MCSSINLELSSFTQPHNTSWWQPLVQRTASQGTLVLYEHCLSRKEKILDYSYAEHWTSRKHNRNTPGCIFPCFFCQKSTPDMFCTPVPTLCCHCCKNLVVGHTPSYIVSNYEAYQTDSSRDTAIFVSYPSP